MSASTRLASSALNGQRATRVELSEFFQVGFVRPKRAHHRGGERSRVTEVSQPRKFICLGQQVLIRVQITQIGKLESRVVRVSHRGSTSRILTRADETVDVEGFTGRGDARSQRRSVTVLIVGAA